MTTQPHPGPYKLMPSKIPNGMTNIVQQDDDNFLIGYVLREGTNKNVQKVDDATARMFEKAPDMLDLLRTLVALMPAGGFSTSDAAKIIDYIESGN